MHVLAYYSWLWFRIHILDESYLRWLENTVIEIGKRHKFLDFQPSKLKPLLVKYRNGEEYDYDFSGNNEDHNYTFAKKGSLNQNGARELELDRNQWKPFEIVTEGAEMEQGIYSIQFHLFENGDESTASKNLTDFVKSCKTDFIYDETYDIFDEYTYKAYKLLSGQSIVPFGFLIG